jgi:hypothetical protein
VKNELADNTALLPLGDQLAEKPDGHFANAPGEISAEPEEEFVQPRIADVVNALRIFGEKRFQFVTGT